MRSKLTIKTLEQRQWCRSDVFILNFEQISHLFLVFQLLTSKHVFVLVILPTLLHIVKQSR